MWSRERARSVGARVAQARHHARVTQAELATQVTARGMVLTQGMLSRLERGEATANLYDCAEMLQAIAAATATDPVWLAQGTEADHASPASEPASASDLFRGIPVSSGGWIPRIGDHVRIWGLSTQTCEECPHLGGEEGVTGKVVAEVASPGAPSHPYLVVFDEPLICEARPACFVELRVRHFAGRELRPA